MRKVSLFILVFLMVTSSFAQDVIYTRNGRKVEGKIMGITPDSILYVPKSAPDGQQRSIPVRDINKIRYENGKEETFHGTAPSTDRFYDPGPGDRDFRHWLDLGIGLGLDYGGLIGVKACANVIPNLGVFGGVGYYVITVGWNTGVVWHILAPAHKRWIRPNVKVMAGTNGATYVSGSGKYQQVFYGFTPGAGAEIRFGRGKRNGIDLDINIPIHGKDFYDMLDKMKHDPTLTGVTNPSPVQVSLGYHHEF